MAARDGNAHAQELKDAVDAFVSEEQGSVCGACVHVGDLHGKTNGAETCSSCVLLESSPALVLLSEGHLIRQEAKKRYIIIII